MGISKFIVTYYIMFFIFNLIRKSISKTFHIPSGKFLGNIMKPLEFSPLQICSVFQHADLPVFRSVRVSLHSTERQIKPPKTCNKNILAVILESININWGKPFTTVSYGTLKIHEAIRGTLQHGYPRC